jgi:hypothetical protein
MDDLLEDRRQHYLQLAERLRAIARQARFPAARKLLIEVAKRFERRATEPEPAWRLQNSRSKNHSGRVVLGR